MLTRFQVGDRIWVTVPTLWEYGGTILEVDGGTPWEPTQYRVKPDEGAFVVEMQYARWVEEAYCLPWDRRPPGAEICPG